MYNIRTIVVLPLLSLFMTACTTYGSINNQPIASTKPPPEETYSLHRAIGKNRSNEVTLLLAFSGGGTRAAALSYGVLEAMRDTTITIEGEKRRLLDEIDVISSVSGGSFTAAYFGLYGDRLFTDFDDDFLRRDVTGELKYGLFNPALWFSRRGRTEMAVEFYEESLFKETTFADMQRLGTPLIVINATDLGAGIRFSFIQGYFDLLCSDLSSFPVARAVTASAAVPVLFNPVILKNYDGCDSEAAVWLEDMKQITEDSPQISHVVDGLLSYAKKDERQYIHLIDGGITDNLGLLAVYEIIEVAGGAREMLDLIDQDEPAPHFVIITVNASTTPQYDIESTNKMPSIENTINAMTDVQIHRNNASTLELIKNGMKRWTKELETPDMDIEHYLIEVDFKSLPSTERRIFFNQIPTDFSLTAEQVQELIEVGRELLLNNPEFRRFISNIK